MRSRWISLAVILGSTLIGVALGALLQASEAVGWILVEGPFLGGMLGFVLPVFAGRFILLPLQLPVACFLAFLLFGPETICLWDPLRDTVIASPDVRLKFRDVRTGLSTDELLSQVGEPLKVYGSRWHYTLDGKCAPKCDKAWLMLAVDVADGKVTWVHNQWAPD